MKTLINIIIITYFTIAIVYPQSSKNFYSVRDSISIQNISNHLKFLADDSLEGRGVGSKGSQIASKYIASKFSEFGLKKIPDQISYFQNIPMHGSLPLENSKLLIASTNDTFNLKINEDYFLYRCGQQTFLPGFVPIVFVGYGIVAPEFDYNDYQTVDVEGKIVAYIEGEPNSNDEDYFNGNAPTIYSYPESKRRIALGRGAAGSIQLSIDQYNDWSKVRRDFNNEDVTLAYSVSSNLSLIINSKIAEKLFVGADYSLNDVHIFAVNNRMKSFELKTKLKFSGEFKERDFIERNVIGVVDGSDSELKDTYLIISAHYDHLGIGEVINCDSIYNGALDNAIGVSVLLELAKSFSDLTTKPKRSILFIATTGEEKGLLGSSYYVDNPVVPLYKSVANLNIDGVALFKDFSSIVPIGSEYSTIADYVLHTANAYNLKVEEIPLQFRSHDAFNKSDQLSFAIAGVPSILILEGLTNKSKSKDEVLETFINYYLNVYHTPFDDLNQSIDIEAAMKHAKVMFDFAYRLANGTDVPHWNSGSPFINSRLRSTAEKK